MRRDTVAAMLAAVGDGGHDATAASVWRCPAVCSIAHAGSVRRSSLPVATVAVCHAVLLPASVWRWCPMRYGCGGLCSVRHGVASAMPASVRQSWPDGGHGVGIRPAWAGSRATVWRVGMVSGGRGWWPDGVAVVIGWQCPAMPCYLLPSGGHPCQRSRMRPPWPMRWRCGVSGGGCLCGV